MKIEELEGRLVQTPSKQMLSTQSLVEQTKKLKFDNQILM